MAVEVQTGPGFGRGLVAFNVPARALVGNDHLAG
jgi:hypothetical protein